MALTPAKIEQIKKELEGLEPEEQQERMQEILATLNPEEKEQLVGKQQCPFCLMVEGKIPTVKAYEDQEILAILDINPATPGHTLVFTKKHYALLTELSPDESAKLFSVVQKVAQALTKGLNAAGINVYVASGPGAGQTAPHLLVNVIPRFENDGIRFGWPSKKQSEDDLKQIGAKISESLEEEKPIKKKETVEKDEDWVVG